jgi:uroporphyrinogen decarboxylase
MLPRERVIQVIRHEKPDRIPIYGWVRANLEGPIRERFGSCDAFEDHFGFDYAHLFGGPSPYDWNELERLRATQEITPQVLRQMPVRDPNDSAAYEGLRQQIRHHKEQRGRFVYCQTPGILEPFNGYFGIENHLAYILLYEDELHELYRAHAEWTRQFAMNCIDLGVDMVHVSDDWGAQNGLLISPTLWWKMIFPYHKPVCDAVRGRGTFLSLHSDGNINAVVDGVVQLGYQVVHPWQESAGMSLDTFRERYRGVFSVMGGLDVQTTIGFGKLEFLRAEIERIMGLFADGGLLFCTSHFVQDHCSLDELVFAFETARRTAGTLAVASRGER